MLAAHFKLALRNLSKNRLYSVINILGLAVGIAACLLIFRLVQYELSFNKNFKNYDRIVRVVTTEHIQDGSTELSVCIPIPAMEAMRNTVPQFEQMCCVREVWPNIIVPNPDLSGPPLKKFSPDPRNPEVSFFAEPSFFQIFDLQWLAGDPTVALNDIGSAVLSQKMAEKCFGTWEAAMGQTLLLDNLVPVTVRGVVADFPANCDFPVNALISYATLKPNKHLYFYDDNWGSCSSNNQVYALLHDAGQWASASAALAKVGEKEYIERGYRSKEHSLQAFSDVHHNESFGSGTGYVTPKSRLWVLSSIGLLILVMACFNFINLATAQASLRAKEVGVRKTLGGNRSRLVGQFMSETALVVCLSVLLGAALAFVAAPLLQHISDVPNSWPFFSNPSIWAFLGIVALAVILLAGLYPAWVLAGFNPIQALKNNLQQGASGGTFLRKSLVVSQFFIAQALIIGAIVIIQQLDYVHSRDLGFEKGLVYTFLMNNDSTTIARQNTLKQRLLQIPSIESVSLCSDQPSSGNTWNTNFRFGNHSDDEPFNTSLKFCDADWQETYGFRLKAGRWLEPSDTMREAVVNETMLRRLGVAAPEEAIGQPIRLGGGRRVMKVVGVVEDFHTHSLREEHEPILLTTRRQFYSEAGVKIRHDNVAATTAALQKVYDEILPEQVFIGQFLDESIADFYTNENRFSATCKGFGLLAVFISCLGLLGLAAHAAQRRTKEIGIRKVLGASVAGITGLLAKDFLILVIASFAIAVPIAYWFMQKWLSDFAYRIDIQWWMFAVAGAAAVAIAFLTVSFQSIKAALANPVESLRSE